MTPPSPQGTALSPDCSDGQAANLGRAAPAARERVPWRSVGASIAAFGAPAGIGVLHTLLGEIVAVTELMLTLTIAGTALFGSPDFSDRAFRLLRWIGNRPEPSAPAACGAAKHGQTTTASVSATGQGSP